MLLLNLSLDWALFLNLLGQTLLLAAALSLLAGLRLLRVGLRRLRKKLKEKLRQERKRRLERKLAVKEKQYDGLLERLEKEKTDLQEESE